MSDSVRPHRRQPTRLCRPWDSPGNNTRVGCHFLLQCMKVKSESEVAQSCPTLSNPMDCSLPGSSIHGIFQARVLEWGAIAFSVIGMQLLVIVSYDPLYFCGNNGNFSLFISFYWSESSPFFSWGIWLKVYQFFSIFPKKQLLVSLILRNKVFLEQLVFSEPDGLLIINSTISK